MKCSLLVLSCYLDDELEARKRGELEAHLVACQRCRGGLAHLREEVERIGGLARVHVPDHSAHSLMEITGLIGADDPLPPRRRAALVVDRPADLPPWLGGEAGAALPWSSPRPGRVRPLPHPMPGADEMRSFPDEAAPAAAMASAHLGSGPDAAAMELAGAALPPPDATGVPALPFDVISLSILRQPETEVESVVEEPEPISGQTTMLPVEAMAAEPSVDAMLTEPAEEATLAEPTSGEAPSAELFTEMSPPIDAPPTEPVAQETPPAPPAAGDPPVSVWTTETETPTDSSTIAAEAAAADAGGIAGVEAEAPAGPLAAPRAGVFARIRDYFAMRRVVSRAPREVYDDSVEIISGTGAPIRAGRSRAELARRRSEALRPAGMPIPDADGDADEAPGMMRPNTYVGHVNLEQTRREPALREQLPPPARPSAAFHTEAPVVEPLTAPQRETGTPWQPREENPLTGWPMETPRQPIQPSPTEIREGRRLLALFSGAVLVMFAVGVASARSSSPIPAPAPSAQQSLPSAPVVPPSGAPAASQQPQASAPAVQQPPAAQPPPVSQQPAGALSGVHVLGDGGTGWQIQTIRYGDHTSFLRVAFDLAPGGGTTTGSPKVTIGLSDATTLLVEFNGVIPAGSVGSLPSAKFVTSVKLLQPSPVPGATVYQFKLARALTINPSYLSGPTRLIIDLG